MGIKKINKLFLAVIILALTFINPKIFAANETQTIPVRVGIGNQNFSTYNYQKISLFTTGEAILTDKTTKTPVTTIFAENPIEISIKDGIFTVKNGEESFTSTNNLILECHNGLLGITNLKRKGKQALYRTSFEIVKKPNCDLFYLINVLDVQDYLKGVVPNEMPTSFGLEALKAQAIAARNYVLSPRSKSNGNYDVVDSVASQVYFGANTEELTSNRAVDETEGLVATYNWQLILAQYSSTAGGYTESFANAFSDPVNKKFPSNAKPYLIAKADMLSQTPLKTEEEVRQYYMNRPESYDIRSPYYRWQKDWTIDELNEVLKKTILSQSKTGFITPKPLNANDIGELIAIKPLRRGDSGKLISVEIQTTKGSFTAQKELVIRRIFQKNNISLPSANVVFDMVYDDKNELTGITAYGGGFGHGVGMSQFGAGFMGKELKMPFDKIIKHYYTGVTISSIPLILSSHPTQRQFTQKIYFEHKNANLVIDNKFNLSKINLIINDEQITIPLTQGLTALRAPLIINISNYIKKGENTITFCYPLDEGTAKATRLYIEAINPNANNFGF